MTRSSGIEMEVTVTTNDLVLDAMCQTRCSIDLWVEVPIILFATRSTRNNHFAIQDTNVIVFYFNDFHSPSVLSSSAYIQGQKNSLQLCWISHVA